MNLSTIILVTKGICLAWIPTGTAIAAGLPETGVNTLFGMPIKFWCLLMSASVAGAGGLLAFISTSFGTFLASLNGVDRGAKPPDAPKP